MTFKRLPQILHYCLISGFSLITLTLCSPKKPVDRTSYEVERSERELKRLTKADIMAEGEKIGKLALSAISENLQNELKAAIANGGVPHAIDYCNLNALSLVGKIEDSLGVSIKRVSDKTRNPADSITAMDLPFWEAYTYASENDDAQIQELNEEALILTKPIKIANGLCLNCHGNPGTTITTENYTLIQSKYPNDLAINYNLNDLRGMWRIIIPKKTIVNSFQAK